MNVLGIYIKYMQVRMHLLGEKICAYHNQIDVINEFECVKCQTHMDACLTCRHTVVHIVLSLSAPSELNVTKIL